MIGFSRQNISHASGCQGDRISILVQLIAVSALKIILEPGLNQFIIQKPIVGRILIVEDRTVRMIHDGYESRPLCIIQMNFRADRLFFDEKPFS